MMKKMKIVNWEKSQHYKDRRPPWIKLYVEIIEEFDENGNEKKFFQLPDSAKLTLIGLLCLASHYGGVIPSNDAKWLQRRLGIQKIDIEPLIKAGYVVVDEGCTDDASKVASKVATDMLAPETETETETETEKNSRKSKDIPTACFEIVEKLKAHAKAHSKVFKGDRTKAANTIRLMVDKDGLDYETITKAVDAYTETFTEAQYEPEIFSASSLRDKWNSLQSFLRRREEQTNPFMSKMKEF